MPRNSEYYLGPIDSSANDLLNALIGFATYHAGVGR